MDEMIATGDAKFIDKAKRRIREKGWPAMANRQELAARVMPKRGLHVDLAHNPPAPTRPAPTQLELSILRRQTDHDGREHA